jgi:sRNA-binding carbon storage regulator CsrA
MTEEERKKMLDEAQGRILGIKKFNKSTEVFAPKETKVYQKEIYGNKYSSVHIEIDYSLYKIIIGAGNRPKFIWCNRDDKIEMGDSTLYLNP